MSGKSYTAAPVYLDENDELRAAVPKTPNDGQFRRGLYVMLIVLGILAASSLIYARNARTDVLTAQRQNEILLMQLQRNDEDARVRAQAATAERATQSQKLDALQGFVAALLANSSDPAIKAAVQDAVKKGNLDPSVLTGTPSTPVKPSASATPAPAPQRSSGATPTPAAGTPPAGGGATTAPPAPPATSTPRPQPLPLPTSLPCIPVLGLPCP